MAEGDSSEGESVQNLDGSHTDGGETAILFVFIGLLIGVLARYMKNKLQHGVPYTVVLLLIGFTIGGCSVAIGNSGLGLIGETLGDLTALNPHTFLQVFIPALIFDSAFSVNFHIMVREFGQALLLAGPGVILNTFFTAIVCRYWWPYGWSWSLSLLFGAIISATDPVAVVALLRELGASKRLATLIEAESLLNDGSAFVVYEILVTVVITGSTTAGEVVTLLLRLSVLGSLFGIGVGLFIAYWLSNVFNDALVETSLTLVAAYLAFFTAESTALKVSGVLAVVFLGLTLSRFRSVISPKTTHSLHLVWHMIEYVANTLIFLLSGVIVADKIFGSTEIGGADFGWLMVLYVGVHITRALTIAILYYPLKHIGYGINWKQAVILWFGALRGAIGLALALLTELEDEIEDRDRIVFHVAGIVFLTLLINGMLTKKVLLSLKMDAGKPHSNLLIRHALEHLQRQSDDLVNVLRTNYHFSDAKFNQIQEHLPNYLTLLDLPDEVPTKEGSHEADEADIKHRLLASMKSFYWKQYEDGMTSRASFDILVNAAEEGLDAGDLFVQWEVIKRECSVPRTLQFLHRYKALRFATNRVLYSTLSIAVELITALIFAVDRMGVIVDAFPEWAGLPQMERVQSELKEIEKLARTEWTNLRRSYPGVTRTIQTRHAAVFILNRDSLNVHHLLEDGVLQDGECTKIISVIDKRRRARTRARFSPPNQQEIFKTLPFISPLSDSDMGFFMDKSELKLKSEGEKLFAKGDKEGAFYVILRGLAELSFNDDVKLTIGPGVTTGAWAALAGERSMATCTTLTPVECWKFSKSVTKDFFKHPMAEIALWKHAAMSIIRAKFSHMFPGDSFNIGQMCNHSSFLALNGRQVLPEFAFLCMGSAVRESNGEVISAPAVIAVSADRQGVILNMAPGQQGAQGRAVRKRSSLPLTESTMTIQGVAQANGAKQSDSEIHLHPPTGNGHAEGDMGDAKASATNRLTSETRISTHSNGFAIGEAFTFTNAKLLLFDGNDEAVSTTDGSSLFLGGDRQLSSKMSIGLIYTGRNRARGGVHKRNNFARNHSSMGVGNDNREIPEIIRHASFVHATAFQRHHSSSFNPTGDIDLYGTGLSANNTMTPPALATRGSSFNALPPIIDDPHSGYPEDIKEEPELSRSIAHSVSSAGSRSRSRSRSHSRRSLSRADSPSLSHSRSRSRSRSHSRSRSRSPSRSHSRSREQSISISASHGDHRSEGHVVESADQPLLELTDLRSHSEQSISRENGNDRSPPNSSEVPPPAHAAESAEADHSEEVRVDIDNGPRGSK